MSAGATTVLDASPSDPDLRAAAERNDPAALTWWLSASSHGRMGGLVTAAMHHHVDLFGRLVDLIPEHPLARHDADWAFGVAVRHAMPVEPLRRLLPWVENPSDHLRSAVQENHEAAIRLLMPVADPCFARKKWLATRPVRWDWISRLVPYLPQTQQLEWAKRYPGRIVAAQAAERAQQLLTQPPPPARSRRRRT